MIDFSRKSVLSFDCYGTIIDWEAGIVAVVQPILRAHGLDVADEQVLELYAALESAAEAGPYRRYADILADVMRGLGERLGFTPSQTDTDALAASVGDWPPFADSAEALARLKRCFRRRRRWRFWPGTITAPPVRLLRDVLFAEAGPHLEHRRRPVRRLAAAPRSGVRLDRHRATGAQL